MNVLNIAFSDISSSTHFGSAAESRFHVSAKPPAKTAAGLGKKETIEHRTLNHAWA
jgi:hypothetical protein